MKKIPITIGMITSEYGGPEEGGWYYDHFTPSRVIRVASKHYRAVLRRLAAIARRENETRPSLHSVNSIGRYQVLQGDIKEDMPQHYE